MQEVANSQTAINIIGSNTNEGVTANTVLNSSTATTEFQNSNLETNFSARIINGFNASAGNITNSRVLVTSNDNSGPGGSNISYSNDVGPETQADTTFIINEANHSSANSGGSGNVGFNGIQIN